MIRTIISIAILLFIVSCAQQENVATNQAEDKEAIHALMWRYARAFEDLDPDAYASLFAQDGRFGPTQGRDALRETIKNLKESRKDSPREYLLITDARIEFVDKTHARYHQYWMTVFEPAEQGASPNVTAVGRGMDELVKIDGQWLIQTRLASQE